MSARSRTLGVALLAAAMALAAAQVAPSSPSPAPTAKPSRPAPRRPSGPPDVYFLEGGDRVTGHTLAKRKRDFRVQTPFGLLTLPRDRVERVLWAGEREEWVRTPAPAPSPTPEPTPELALVVVGQSFWQAWDRRESVDPTLRLRVWVDGVDLATYVDAQLDPQDLPGATVNSFAFDSVEISAVSTSSRDVRPGRITLRLGLPAPAEGAGAAPRRLRLAYQVNAGTRDAAEWRDAAATELEVPFQTGRETRLELRQDAGRMEFSGFGRKRMKYVETFRLELRPLPAE